MWNAYTTTNKALPQRDLRVNSITVDNTITYANIRTFTAAVVHENLFTENVEIKALVLGDLVKLLIPQLSNILVGPGPFVAYKELALPAELRPALGKIQSTIRSENQVVPAGAKTGFCKFEDVVLPAVPTKLHLYTNVDGAAPIAGESKTYPLLFSYIISQ